jgi:MFS family permease
MTSLFLKIDLLQRNKNYRKLYMAQMISYLGSMMTYMAVPYQIYEITKSSFWVGILGTVQLLPLFIFGLIGGVYADRFERKKILITAEMYLAVAAIGLFINAYFANPNLAVLFFLSVTMSAVNGFHRPAMEAMTQQIVSRDDLLQVGTLNSFKFGFSSIAGPALSGLLIAVYGVKISYFIDFLTFLISIILLRQVVTPEHIQKIKSSSTMASISDGFKYAVSRSELVGTYVVDILAMIFAMPMALYPAMAANWGGAAAAGWLYSAIPAGSLFVSVFSGWTHSITRKGKAVILSATIWGFAIIALAFADNLYLAFACLFAAGVADMTSGIFRGAIWNETIPHDRRGRLASIEMLSYMSGPMIGNARAGFVASQTSNFISIFTGGIICVIACLMCIWILPKFWWYEKDK